MADVPVSNEVQDPEIDQRIVDINESQEAFSYSAAIDGKLCTIIKDEKVFGTGIGKLVNGNIVVTVNNVEYKFNNEGKPVGENATGYTLKQGISSLESNTSGTGTAQYKITRSVDEDGNETYEVDPSYVPHTGSVVIDSLNARDQFAVQALRGILEKIPNPSILSKDEMTYYCGAAYEWASFMMEKSGNARNLIVNAEGGEIDDYTEKQPIGNLRDNTERLLNNIEAALERTDAVEEKEEEGEIVKEYSERIINPKINNKLKEFLRATADSEDDTKIEPQEYEKPDKEEEGIEFWEYEALIKLLRRTQAKLTSPTQEDYQDGNKPVFLDRILIPELRGSLKRTSNPKDTSTTYIRAEEFLYPYKEFLKHQNGVGEIGSEFAAFEDLTKMFQNLQETLDSKKYQRVVLYKWDDFKTVLTDIKTNLNTINTTLTTLNTTLTTAFQTQATALGNINNSLQAFTTAMDTRLSNIQSAVDGLQADVTDIKSNYATGSEIEAAKDDIIDAMPTCKYNPPTD